MQPPMPLGDARLLLRGVTAFIKGEAEDATLASDTLWDALLSLEDAREFCEVATRLDWQFHPRGFDNTDLHQRYGDGIVPWLASKVDDDGTLTNVPWCIVPCLLACGSDDAFALALRVRRVGDRPADLIVDWRARHPEAAARLLAEHASRGDARARAHLRAMSATPPALGDVLATLDAAALRLYATRLVLWPAAGAIVRAVAARRGDDWGLALERVEGSGTGVFGARVTAWAFGSQVRGPVPGAVAKNRPAPLGPPEAALPLLGLDGARVVAHVPDVAIDGGLVSASPVLLALARALLS